MNGDLSRVQHRALQMLMADEQRGAVESETRELKMALLGTGVPIQVLFPEIVPEEEVTERQQEEAFQSEGPVEWVSETNTEEAYEVLEKLGVLRGEGKLSADDLVIDPALLEE